MITVIIATSGRPKSLSNTLESLAQTHKPKCSWNLMVVVNGGDITSFKVASSFETSLPIKVYFLKETGKNRALNSAIGDIVSGLVVFTDDDIKFDPLWLCQWSEQTNCKYPNFILCGPIELEMDPHIKQIIHALELPEDFLFSKTPVRENGPICGEQCWGGNMAIHSDVFKLGHRFNEQMGPNGTSNYPMGSEVEFCIRMEKIGFCCQAISEPKVFHKVRADQLTDKSISGRYFRAGRSAYLCRRRDQNSVKPPWDLFSGLFFLKVRLLIGKWHFCDQERRHIKNTYAFIKGQIYEYFFSTIAIR